MEKKEMWGDHCDEMCPDCESEVELPNALGVYRCPSCGRWIVNCSMCQYLSDKGTCPKVCPLEYEANYRNRMEE